jgi:hypothetical protein
MGIFNFMCSPVEAIIIFPELVPYISKKSRNSIISQRFGLSVGGRPPSPNISDAPEEILE